MSQPERPLRLPEVGPLHYMILCGLSLGLIFLAQMRQGLLLTNTLVVLVGALGLVSRLRLAPVMLLLVLAAAQLMQRRAQGRFVFIPWETTGGLPTNDLLLAAGVLAYCVCHFRLQGLWHEIVPRDPRQRAGEESLTWFSGRMVKPVVAQKRPARHLSATELIWFLLSLGPWALAGQLLWVWLSPPRNTLGLLPWVWQLLVLAWTVFLGSFISRQILLHWRHRQMSRTEAEMVLQDILWKETRGEQRKQQRWIKWKEVTGFVDPNHR